jgi:hypothetical protein
MASNTCETEIAYNSLEDMLREPFRKARNDKAYEMYQQGKCEFFPNVVMAMVTTPTYRAWVDRAAAQEFLDWVVANAPTHNVSIVSTAIVDV